MIHSRAEPRDSPSDMQLTGKLALSAAALLLVSWAYRLYRARPAAGASRTGDSGKAGVGRDVDGAGPAKLAGKSPQGGRLGLRRKQIGRNTTGGAAETPAPGATEVQILEGPKEEDWRGAGSELSPGQSAPDEEGPCPRLALSPEPSPRGNMEQETVCEGHYALSQLVESSRAGLYSDDCGNEVAQGYKVSLSWGREHQGGKWAAQPKGGNAMSKTPVFSQTAGTLRATSHLGMAMSQWDHQVDALHTFSSVAEVQVEENYIREKGTTPQERSGPGRQTPGPGPRLRGKIYDYFVESTSQSVSRDRLGLGARVPEPFGIVAVTQALGPGAAGPGGSSPPSACAPSPVGDPENPAGETSMVGPTIPLPPSALGRGFGRKESFLQIVDNPELQLQLEGFSAPDNSTGEDLGTQHYDPLGSPKPTQLSDTTGASQEPRLELVAGTNFFHPPLAPKAAPQVHLDLGNCLNVLSMAKKQRLDDLKEAAYRVMSDNYLQVLRSRDIFGQLNAAERELILQRRLRGRRRLAVLDVGPREGVGRLCYYDDAGDSWHLLSLLPQEVVSRGCAVGCLFNYLFVVAGCEGPGSASGRVFCYNPCTDIWSEVCPLNQARPHCKLVALDGRLYAIGGECLNSVERYDPRTDRWDFIAPLPDDTFAVAHTAAACDGELYVTGGTLRYLLLRSTDRVGRWLSEPTGGGQDRTAEMVTVGGFLYRFDVDRSLGLSVYRCGAGARLWSECATRQPPCPTPFRCAVADGLIYCVGREFCLRFRADCISPGFEPKELKAPPSPLGSLLPTVLVLPPHDLVQTCV
ncbi:kelch domain-containing protein 7A [Tachyglossus aculeatus]|uniref:kelch domain-containing protein 7A n=1 Tax=Tachyglossus aculeatus TaxID=9261 RepID=UPI0018F5C92F|nr:kelch domain-containing protein 7A [Tachyglossus aculeatus]